MCFIFIRRIFIRASVNIVKGDRLTYSKVKIIMPTLLRRQELIHVSCISCCCLRCSDPTELNSNFSSLKCPKCRVGFLQSLNPLGLYIYEYLPSSMRALKIN